MAETSHIEWTDATWNPITGCTMVSAGCTNCYAMGLAGSRLRNHPSRAGLTRESGGRQVWTGEVRLNEGWLDQPMRWNRPRKIFVCAHGDLFHEAVPDDWIDQVWAVMAHAKRHTFQVLTKRPRRAKAYLTQLTRRKERLMSLPLPNVWLGTSIEDQFTADSRIPHLLATPAAVRFVSAEPLLGPVDLAEATRRCLRHPSYMNALLHWVIVGGESGRDARPMHPDWARSLRDQCQAAGVAFFFKQWGEWGPVELRRTDGQPVCPETYDGPIYGHSEVGARLGKKLAGRLLDGRTWDEMPGAVNA